MLAMVAVASAAGSASLRRLPRVFMRVRPSRRRASQFETSGDRCSGGGVALGELTGEGADWAAAACLLLDLVLDHEVEPAVDAGPGVEVVKELALPAEDGVDSDVDDGVDEVVAVIEVVVELAAAGAGASPRYWLHCGSSYDLDRS